MIQKLALLLLCISALSGCARIDKEKFDKVYRSVKSVQAATSVGVNFEEFGKLLQSYATELSILNDQLKTDKERELFGEYAKVLEMYSDSQAIWKAEMSHVDSPVEVTIELKPIVEKYALSTESWQGLHYTYPIITSPSHSIKIIWSKASAQLELANRFREEGNLPK